MPHTRLTFPREEIEGSLVDRFERVVLKYPNNLAIKCAQGEFSYLELNQRANHLAQEILKLGGKPKTPVALFMRHDANPIIGMMGLLKAGRTLVPLNPSSPNERIIQILNSSGAGIVITDQKYLKRLSKFSLKRNIQIIDIDLVSSALPNDNLGLRIAEDDLVSIIYTSGSTGVPKGVMHIQQTLMHNTWIQTEALKIIPQDRHTLISHISYVSGSTDILRTLLNGGSLYPIDFLEVGLKGLSQLIQKEQITIYHSVPTIFRRLMEEQGKNQVYPSVRVVHLGGEPVYSGDADLVRNNFSPKCVLLNNLGSTEVPTYRRFEVASDTRIKAGNLPVGYAISDKNVKILDEDGLEVGVGEAGEIVVESKYMSWGYFKDVERTKEFYRPIPTMDKPGRFFSGDLGVMDSDGKMRFLGRKDYQVKIHGNRVELGEVEANLISIEGVYQAVAIVKKKDKEDLIVGYIVPSKGKSISIEEIRQEMLGKLPVFMVPKEYVLMDSFPYTQTNKINREALPEPNYKNESNSLKLVLPRTELEIKLAKIWQETLNIDRIGVSDNFFSLGGDSLTAVNLFLSIEEAFGVKMPVSILLNAGDIEKQAKILGNTNYIVDWSPIVKVQPLGSKPPLFCLFGKGGNPLTFRQMSEYFGEDQPVYFLQARGLSGRETPLKIIEEISKDFIQEMKKIYPEGPYRLCGASFGGMVAFEIAQQLKAKEEFVDLVVLFDTYGPGYPEPLPGYSKVKRKIKRIGYYYKKHFSSLRNADGQGRINYIRYYWDYLPEYLKSKIQNLKENFNRWNAERYLPSEIKEVIRSNMEASAKYHPEPFDGKVVLIRATHQRPGGIYDLKLGWGKVGIKDLRIHEVEAHHGNMVFEPSVQEVVKIMKEYIE